MTMNNLTGLDRDRLRDLFDLRKSFMAQMGGAYEDDPNPTWRRLRQQAPVHEGTVHELSGCQQALFFHGLPEADRPHFSAFTFDACDEAYRNPATFASSPDVIDLGRDLALTNSMLSMGGAVPTGAKSATRRSRTWRARHGNGIGSVTSERRQLSGRFIIARWIAAGCRLPEDPVPVH